jgi:hypothetical protein
MHFSISQARVWPGHGPAPRTHRPAPGGCFPQLSGGGALAYAGRGGPDGPGKAVRAAAGRHLPRNVRAGQLSDPFSVAYNGLIDKEGLAIVTLAVKITELVFVTSRGLWS